MIMVLPSCCQRAIGCPLCQADGDGIGQPSLDDDRSDPGQFGDARLRGFRIETQDGGIRAGAEAQR